TIMLVVLFLSFVFPLFALIPKASKWTSFLTWPIAIGILVGQWMTYIIVVMPDVVKPENWIMPLSIEAGLFLGVFGLFLSSIFGFSKHYPMLSIADPLLLESINDAH
nr:hypothetical protein [Oligoflexales bacterium]